MDDASLATLGLILLIACVVAMISRRLRLPYSVGLVVAGAALAFAPVNLSLPLTRELIFNVFLPPLVFEAALQLRWKPFSGALPITLALAFFGVPLAAATVAFGMHVLLHWTWLGAALFGMLIAATDPVAVIAAFKEMKVEPRLSMIVEAESLLNDGTAAVGFGVLVGLASGEVGNPAAIAASLARTVFGGIASGGLVAGGVLLLANPAEDHLVEITLTTIAAYGSFMLANHFGMSGVLASMTAGLIIGNLGMITTISEASRTRVLDFWEYAAFLANSIVFILIGSSEGHRGAALFTSALALAIPLVLVGRAVAVYPLCTMFDRSKLRVDKRQQHVLVWGGLRGALALALALALPDGIAERQRIIMVAFAVVAFSVLIQGLTAPWLIRRLGLIRPSADDRVPAIPSSGVTSADSRIAEDPVADAQPGRVRPGRVRPAGASLPGATGSSGE